MLVIELIFVQMHQNSIPKEFQDASPTFNSTLRLIHPIESPLVSLLFVQAMATAVCPRIARSLELYLDLESRQLFTMVSLN